MCFSFGVHSVLHEFVKNFEAQEFSSLSLNLNLTDKKQKYQSVQYPDRSDFGDTTLPRTVDYFFHKYAAGSGCGQMGFGVMFISTLSTPSSTRSLTCTFTHTHLRSYEPRNLVRERVGEYSFPVCVTVCRIIIQCKFEIFSVFGRG